MNKVRKWWDWPKKWSLFMYYITSNVFLVSWSNIIQYWFRWWWWWWYLLDHCAVVVVVVIFENIFINTNTMNEKIALKIIFKIFLFLPRFLFWSNIEKYHYYGGYLHYELWTMGQSNSLTLIIKKQTNLTSLDRWLIYFFSWIFFQYPPRSLNKLFWSVWIFLLNKTNFDLIYKNIFSL